MFQQIRTRYGLHWRGKYPPVARPLFALFVMLLLFALASSMDYYYAKAAELERLQPVMKSYSDVVVGVMNGSVRMVVGTEAFECHGGTLGTVKEFVK